MIAVESVERSKGSPSSAQLFGCVASKSTDIRSDHGYLEHGGKGNRLWNSDSVFIPLAEVVTEPMSVRYAQISSIE